MASFCSLSLPRLRDYSPLIPSLAHLSNIPQGPSIVLEEFLFNILNDSYHPLQKNILSLEHLREQILCSHDISDEAPRKECDVTKMFCENLFLRREYTQLNEILYEELSSQLTKESYHEVIKTSSLAITYFQGELLSLHELFYEACADKLPYCHPDEKANSLQRIEFIESLNHHYLYAFVDFSPLKSKIHEDLRAYHDASVASSGYGSIPPENPQGSYAMDTTEVDASSISRKRVGDDDFEKFNCKRRVSTHKA